MFQGDNLKFKYLSINTMNLKCGIFYQLRLTSKLGRKTIGLGTDYIKALSIAQVIDKEIEKMTSQEEGVIDLDKLKNIVQEHKEPAPQSKTMRLVEKDDLIVLWNKFVEFHVSTKLWAETTIYTTVRTVSSLLEQCPYQKLENKTELVTWIFSDAGRNPNTSKTRLKWIVAAIDWNSKQGVIPRKWGIEYRDLLNSINLKKIEGNKSTLDEDGNIDIFKVKEIYEIIDALKSDRYSRFRGKHNQYWQYVYFLWLTGCRPSEAIALKWENINLTKKQINFREIQVNASGRIISKKGTKTVPSRIFPINDELVKLLTLTRNYSSKQGYVFLNQLNKPISQQALNGVWNTLLKAINMKYRVPYQIRHSMISYHANNDFPLHKLSILVGNSEEIIRKYYLKLDIERISLPQIIQ